MRKRASPSRTARSVVGTVEPVEAGEDLERLAHAQAVGQRQVARHEPDLRHRPRPAPREHVPSDLDRSRVGRDRAEQHEQRRRLARAVRPEERDAIAGPDGEVDPGDGDRVTESLDQAGRAQQLRHEQGILAGASPSNPQVSQIGRRLLHCRRSAGGRNAPDPRDSHVDGPACPLPRALISHDAQVSRSGPWQHHSRFPG